MDCNAPALKIQPCFQYKRILIYHPSNSNKGIAIKGTNLRVSFIWI